MSSVRCVMAAGVVGPHDPRLLRLERERLEVRVAPLERGARPLPGRHHDDVERLSIRQSVAYLSSFVTHG